VAGFIARRVATSIVLLVATSLFVFLILRALPGDPLVAKLGETNVSENVIQELRGKLGLTQPLYEQYFHWLSGAVRGNLGRSYFTQYPVSQLVGRRIAPTFELALLSLFLMVVVAVPAGVISALKPGGAVDRLITLVCSIGMSTPQFVLGIVLIILLSVHLHWLPSRGYTPFVSHPLSNLERMIMPASTLALISGAVVTRFLRASMIQSLRSSYIRTAEGKGVPPSRVVVGHALRNALLPSLTVVGVLMAQLLGGSVIVEQVFGIPGLGALVIDAVNTLDYPIVQAVAMLMTAFFIATSLMVDILYGVLDPRLRTGAGRG
jgi:peptide/nickel transport system permease protein